MLQHGIFKLPALLKELAKNRAVEVTPKSPTPLPGSVIKKQSRWLSYKELKPLKGISYSRMQLKRLEDAGKFPKRIKSGARRYWWEHEVDEWKQRQADAPQSKSA
jgi:prophage regulatory protein